MSVNRQDQGHDECVQYQHKSVAVSLTIVAIQHSYTTSPAYHRLRFARIEGQSSKATTGRRGLDSEDERISPLRLRVQGWLAIT